MQSDTGNIPLRKRAGGAFVQTGNKEYVELKESNKKACKQRKQKHHKRKKINRNTKIMCENYEYCTIKLKMERGNIL